MSAAKRNLALHAQQQAQVKIINGNYETVFFHFEVEGLEKHD